MATYVVISGFYRVNNIAICSYILKNLHVFYPVEYTADLI